jgi:alpha-N-arabinofuranosidase
VYEVNGPDIKTENTFDAERVKTVEKEPVAVKGIRFTYIFLPHSYTMLKGRID